MKHTRTHRLSDGTTMRVRISRTIAGTFYEELHSLQGRPRLHRLYRLGNSMFLVIGDNDLARISHPDYASATSDEEGAEVALKFFTDSAEACIKQAAEENLPVIAMYDLSWKGSKQD